MLSVLHADGDKATRETHASILASRGFRVRAATDGVHCLHELRANAPDLLILDVDLPWGGGDGVLAVMREELHLRKIPVVMTSGLRAFEKGGVRHVASMVPILDKPFSLDNLLETIGSVEAIAPSSIELKVEVVHGAVAPVEREIHRSAGRRVLGLRVQYVDGALLVRGRVKTYYVKQLILAAAMRGAGGHKVDVKFEVGVD